MIRNRRIGLVLLGLAGLTGTLHALPSDLRLALLRQSPETGFEVCKEAVIVGPRDKFRLVVESLPGFQIWVLIQEDDTGFQVLAKPGAPTSFDDVLGTRSWVYPSRAGWFRPDPKVKRTTLVILLSPGPSADLENLSSFDQAAVPPGVVSDLLRKAQKGGWRVEGRIDYNGGLRDDGTGLVYQTVTVRKLTTLVFDLTRTP